MIIKKNFIPHVGLEPTTSRLEVGCAIHYANGAYCISKQLIILLTFLYRNKHLLITI